MILLRLFLVYSSRLSEENGKKKYSRITGHVYRINESLLYNITV